MQQSDQKRVGFFLNDGGGENWRLEVVARTGSHNIRVADIHRDGDNDIVDANWDSASDPMHAPLEMWRNLRSDRRNAHNLSLDKWTYIQVDDDRGKWGISASPNGCDISAWRSATSIRMDTWILLRAGISTGTSEGI